MKRTADAVIIGGGVIGCSIAYNLVVRGLRNVVVLERDFLAGGATGRCGAGVREQWGSETNCLLAKRSIEFFERMQEALGTPYDIEFKQGGYLLLAYTEKQWEQFKRNVSLQHTLGIPSRLVTPEEAKEIVPGLCIDGLVGATFCPKDGHCNPFKVTYAYAHASKRLGASIETFSPVVRVLCGESRIKGVATPKEEIHAPVVINAAGAWSLLVSDMVGVRLPLVIERHQILVTEPVAPVQEPMIMSFHHGLYCQQTPQGQFIMGIGDPKESKGFSMRSSWPFLVEMAVKITALLPHLKDVRVIRQWAGLYDITPDAHPIIGGVVGLDGYYVATGFSGHGFMISPVTGELISELVLGRRPSFPVERLGLERFERGDLNVEPAVV